MGIPEGVVPQKRGLKAEGSPSYSTFKYHILICFKGGIKGGILNGIRDGIQLN